MNSKEEHKVSHDGVDLQTNEQHEQERVARIMELASTRHTVKRVVHSVTGHPKEQVNWGDVHEGATCACGAHWTIADMRM